MSSNNNSDNSGLVFGIAIVGTVAIVFAAFVFAVLAFLAFVGTGLALAAWFRPLTIGKFHLEPHEARGFIYRGIAGAFFGPLFVIFCAILFDLNIVDSAWRYLILGGYVGGSVGWEVLKAKAEVEAAEAAQNMVVLPPQPPVAPQPAPRVLPRQPQEPFRYASWDDEGEHRS